MADYISDDAFFAYAKQQEQEAKLASNKSSGSFQREFEDIKYCGLNAGIPSILRAVDGPPDSHLSAYTARSVTIARVIDDSGKQMKLIRPSFSEDPSYIINKIISRVKQTKWVDGKKTVPVQDTHPEIYNIIDKNGLAADDKRAKFDKGWNGKEVLIMNVIDRSQADWHKANNHTMILAKSVTESNGVEYADEGVSTYAIGPKLNHLFKSYGSWEHYDMAITRTGDLNNPFVVVNASNSPMEVDESVREFISTEKALTDEEKNYEKYDLDKLYRKTTYTKIYNRLKLTIKRIDAALGTDFLKELEIEVEKEKKLFEELYKDADNTAEKVVEAPKSEPVVEKVAEAAPVARTRAAVSNKKPGEDLPHYNDLSDAEKSMIVSAVKKADGSWDIKYNCDDSELAACPESDCGAVAPLSFTKCPVCGLSFE